MRGVTLACLITGACATADPGAAHQEITGGVADGERTAVVAVLADGELWCSGTVIGPHTVLTAGHCIAFLPRERQLTVFAGEVVGGPGTTLAVADAVSHPDLDLGSLANDLGLITLREQAPVAPLALDVRAIDAGFIGLSFDALGYGVTAAGADDAGTRRASTSTVTAIDEDDLTAMAAPGQACDLDSGGPALFDDGGPVVTGVVSRGDPDCIDHATYARVDAARAAFIDPYLEATAAGAAHTGDPCLYEGHCAEGACLMALDDPRLYFCSQACAGSDDCPDGMDCAVDGCRHPPPSPGAAGWPCTDDDQCLGEVCYTAEGSDDAVCTETCLGVDPVCPEGFTCQNPRGIEFYCLAPPGDGCCSSSGRPPSVWLVLLALLVTRRAARPALARGKTDHR